MAEIKDTEKKVKKTAAAKKVIAKKTTAKKTSKSKNIKTVKNLLIMESPHKAKTAKKYLGNKYEVVSTKGHLRDLPASRLGVDVENNFMPEYIVPRRDGKSQIIKELKVLANGCENILLATDPDREGEAIAWHLADILGIDQEKAVRVTFNSITSKVVNEGVLNPRKIDLDLVDSQQARRVLDRLVGYKISPFLWKKVKKGLSAGRVQSVTTRLVVDREREIEAFIPNEYWNLNAVFNNGKNTYTAYFYGNKNKKMAIENQETVEKILNDLKNADYIVDEVKKQEKKRNPKPPFTTSSLQQDASTRLSMRPVKTMSVAQNLYEGTEIKGHGLIGLITYMRTDSTRVSPEAQQAAKEFILDKYGEKYYPETPRIYKSKNNAQDAHEAIRPTEISITPESVKDVLPNEQYRLYKLIWDRFVASQTTSAVYDTISVAISSSKYIFKTNESKIKFDGFAKFYNFSEDDEDSSNKLPNLKEGDKLDFKELVHEQKFTQPPARYNEASLIKAMEENGIGRPSTYAPTIDTILARHYVEKEAKTLKPTQLGFITTDIMIENFSDIVNVDFTANMEQQLDKIEEGEKTYINVLKDFYGDFDNTLKAAEIKFDGIRIEIPNEESDVVCDQCGRLMVYKIGRFGRFLACPGYPECKNTKPIVVRAQGSCPVCNSGLIVRKTKKGKAFYACEKGTDCGFMTWDLPVDEKCSSCGSSMFKRFGKNICVKDGCPNKTETPVKNNGEKDV